MCNYRTQRVTVFSAILLSILTGCADVLLPELSIKSCLWDTEKVTVSFSAEPSASSIEKAFSLTEDGTSVTGWFSFSGTEASFYPLNGIRANYDYAVSVSTQAEDTDGKSLMHEYHTSFTTRSERTPPEVLSISPAPESTPDTQPQEILLTFSEAVDETSFYTAFSISPTLDHFCHFSDNNSVVHIIPAKPLQMATTYRITVSTALTDTSRNSLKKDFSSVFHYGFDTMPLSYTTDLSKAAASGKITLTFNKAIKTDTVSGFISFTPLIDFTIESEPVSSSTVQIQMKDAVWGKIYTLRIKKGIEDVSGNKIADDQNFEIAYNDESHRPVVFISGYMQISNSSYTELSAATDFTSLTLDPVYYGKNIEKDCTLYLVFQTSSQAAGMNLYTVMDAVSFSETNGCCSIILKNAEKLSDTELSQQPLSGLISNIDRTAGKLSVIKYTLEVTNTAKSGLIVLRIAASAADTLGNTLSEENSLQFNK